MKGLAITEDYQLLEENTFKKKCLNFLLSIHYVFVCEEDFCKYADRAYDTFVLSEHYNIDNLWNIFKSELTRFTGYQFKESEVKV